MFATVLLMIEKFKDIAIIWSWCDINPVSNCWKYHKLSKNIIL